MSKEYDAITALHYAAYRPQLHQPILKKRLGDRTFEAGLDIGCGTGQSTLALADYCGTVRGIDPSTDMIAKAIAHPKVRYSQITGDAFEVDHASFDIITLAGSLWYAKSQKLLNEIIRVASKNALLLAYDFDVHLKSIVRQLGFVAADNHRSAYDHQADFSGLQTGQLTLVEKVSEPVHFQLTANELAHLLLSVKEQYTALAQLYGAKDLHKTISAELQSQSKAGAIEIEANTFATAYTVN